MNSNWNLPTGCRQSDIDRQFGSPPTKKCPDCEGGIAMLDGAPYECLTCDGTGEVEIDGTEDRPEDLEADRWMDERNN